MLTISAAVASAKLPVSFRVEKQAMSTPMSTLNDVFFSHYYQSRPVTVTLTGSDLNMVYDNGSACLKMKLNEVSRQLVNEDDETSQEIIRYVNAANPTDTISYVKDLQIGYFQVIIPAKNSKGEYIGYTSYKYFDKENSLASN